MHGFQANQQYWKKLARESDWKACSSQANQWKKSKKLLFLATCPRHDDTLYKLKFSSDSVVVFIVFVHVHIAKENHKSFILS